MNRDLLSYCITDRASFKLVARAMMKRDGKWPSKIVVSREAYRETFKSISEGEPGYTGFPIIVDGEGRVFCVVEGMENR
jgi:hypothetical protein